MAKWLYIGFIFINAIFWLSWISAFFAIMKEHFKAALRSLRDFGCFKSYFEEEIRKEEKLQRKKQKNMNIIRLRQKPQKAEINTQYSMLKVKEYISKYSDKVMLTHVEKDMLTKKKKPSAPLESENSPALSMRQLDQIKKKEV